MVYKWKFYEQRIQLKIVHTMKLTTSFYVCFAILIIFFLFHENAGENFGKEHNLVKRSQGTKKQVGMWFGPRLGRRKRMQTNDNLYGTTPLKKEQLEELIDTLVDPTFVILAVNENKMQKLYDMQNKQWDKSEADMDFQAYNDNYLRF